MKYGANALLLILLLAINFQACKKETPQTDDPLNPYSNPPSSAQQTQISFSGRIMNETLLGIENVSLNLDGHTTTTNDRGEFTFSKVNVRPVRAILIAQSNGYFKGSYAFKPTSNASYEVDIVLQERTIAGSVPVSAGGTVSLTHGGKIKLPANAVTLADGSPYNGNTIQIAAKEIRPDGDLNFSAMVPGGTLAALDTDNNAQELWSYGMLNVELEGDNGEALQLKSSAKATLTMNVPSNALTDAPQTIPMWYFDAVKGIWIEEGAATLQGNEYIGDVAHFTPWNVDKPAAPGEIKGTLVDNNNNPIALGGGNGTGNNTGQPNIAHRIVGPRGNPLSGIQLVIGQREIPTDINGYFKTDMISGVAPIDILLVDKINNRSILLKTIQSSIPAESLLDLGNIVYDPSAWPPVEMQIVKNSSWAAPNQRLDEPVSVLVTGANQLPLANIVVNFQVTVGNGSVSSRQVLTNNFGIASTYWVLGNSTIQALRATTGAASVEFNARLCTPNTAGTTTFTDARDGEIYTMITIGTQTWMAENLRYDVPNTYTSGNTVDTFNTASCIYGYGRLYDWSTIMNGAASSNSNPGTAQGICPNGWHVPTDAEWQALETTLGISAANVQGTSWRGLDEGDALKATIGWDDQKGTVGSSGFNALPSGHYWANGLQKHAEETYFATATEYNQNNAYSFYRMLDEDFSKIYRSQDFKTTGMSCRCVKN